MSARVAGGKGSACGATDGYAAVADVVLVECNARMRRVQELGEWNGNDNDQAFLMVGVPAYLLCI